jgi:hypothetical protein
MKLSMNSIKSARRKHGDPVSAVLSDDRRQKRMSYSHLNNIKKKQGVEPPPDASSITLFRPNDIKTKTGQTMKSGMGYDKAVGDIDRGIPLSQKRDTPPLLVRKDSTVEKQPPIPSSSTARRSSVAEAVAFATKIQNAAALKSPNVVSPTTTSDTKEHVDTTAQVVTSSRPLPAISRPERRTTSHSSDSSKPLAPFPPRRNSSGSVIMSPETPMVGIPQPPMIGVIPTLTQDASRVWMGELTYSKEFASLGVIRLFIPQSSTRIKNLPPFSDSSLCLQKLVSAHYLTKKWFSPFAHPSKKPECLTVEFESDQAQKSLVDMLRNTDSAGIVLEKTCTLLFYFKHNDRLRTLFNTDTSSCPIGVALLQPIELSDAITEESKADQVHFPSRLGLIASFSCPEECHTMEFSYQKI